MAFRFTPLNHLRQSEFRGIGFLEHPEDPQLNGRQVFRGLGQKSRYTVDSRFDHWISGNNGPTAWFHGWANTPKYKECFVFKWDERRQPQRLYGFLCNPVPKTSPRFRLCVLIYHDTKNETQTNFTILDRVNLLRKNPIVMAVISANYPA
jgi:hypothetical protein